MSASLLSQWGAQACPCGRGGAYAQCCGRFHEGSLALLAPDPESLMRSRYTAFVLDVRPYLLETWHPDHRPSGIEAPEVGLKWLGLEVKKQGLITPERGFVAFVARTKLSGKAHRLTEISEFLRVEGRWFYTQALDELPA